MEDKGKMIFAGLVFMAIGGIMENGLIVLLALIAIIICAIFC